MDTDEDSDKECEYNSDNGSSGDESDGVCSTNAGPEEVEEYHYQVLTRQQVADHQMSVVSEVSSVLQLSNALVRTLLDQFGWDKEKLLQKYFEGSTDQFFKDANVVMRDDCGICLSICPPGSGAGLECGHRFCLSCWRAYLKEKIIGEGAGRSIACPAHGCDMLVDNVIVIKSVPEMKTKYQQLIINSFVERNERLRWCPSADCQYVIMVSEREPRPVRCKCGHAFCFFCGEAPHDPVKCSWLQEWKNICGEDSATSNWIAPNAKECPRCNVPTKKSGGCNLVLCKNPACQYNYCWVCLGPWEPHGTSFFSCNRFDDAAAQQARDDEEQQRATLAKYLQCYNRYINHRRTLSFDNKLFVLTEEGLEEVQDHNMSWIKIQYLQKAMDVLDQCHQTLMYSYPFAFFVEKNNQLAIFEVNLKDLELATAALWEYMEHEIDSVHLTDVNQMIQNKYNYCESRRKALLSHVHEGYEKGWWNHVEWPKIREPDFFY